MSILRVGDRLAEERLGVRAHGRAPGVQVVGVLHEADLDADLGQRVVEQVVGAAVQPRAGHDVVARAGQVQDRERLRGLPGRQEQRRDAAFQRRDALLHDVLRRVHDAGVDVAGLGQAEQRRRVVGVVEGVGGGLVDRQGPGVGGDVGGLPGVDLLGLERPVGGRVFCSAHGVSPRKVSGKLVAARGCDRMSASGSHGSATTAHGGPPDQVSRLSGGPFRRTRACLAAVAATQPGHHPGHPTAVGGLPASEPGLDAGAHDREVAYRTRRRGCHRVDHDAILRAGATSPHGAISPIFERSPGPGVAAAQTLGSRA